jgi:hypothetical protein
MVVSLKNYGYPKRDRSQTDFGLQLTKVETDVKLKIPIRSRVVPKKAQLRVHRHQHRLLPDLCV